MRPINTLFKLIPLTLALHSTFSYANDCTNIEQWQPGQAYSGGEQVIADNKKYQANWWVNTNPKTHSNPWQAWSLLGECIVPDNLLQHLKNNTLSSTLLDEPVVRVFYVLPSDMPLNNDYIHSINHAIKNVQDFYTKQVSNGGTFNLARPQNPVEIVYSTKNENWFTYNNPKKLTNYVAWENTANEAKQVMGGHGSNETWIVYGDALSVDLNQGAAHETFAVMMKDDLYGLSGEFDKIKPHYKSDVLNRWLGGLAHEAGHTFQLPHDEFSENNIMYTGYVNYPNVPLLGSADIQITLDNNRFMSLIPLAHKVFESLEKEYQLVTTPTRVLTNESTTLYYREYANGTKLAFYKNDIYLVEGNNDTNLGNVNDLFNALGGTLNTESSNYAATVGKSARNFKALVNGSSGKCLQASSLTVGSDVVQYSCEQRNANMEWQYETVGKWTSIRHQASDLCVSMPDKNDFTVAKLAICDDKNSGQFWQQLPIDETQVYLKNKLSEKCLDTYYGLKDNGINMIQYSCTGAISMRWSQQ
jgi:hypothetical protein